MMKLLILGGTIFLGRHLAMRAQERGHQLTLFNRGRHNANLFPEIEKLRGDRDGDLQALEGHRWDAVIDTCGYVPRIVRASAEKLADKADHYTFISSISVYDQLSQMGVSEDGAIGQLGDPSVEEVTGETYGPLKALCEQAAEDSFVGRALHVRAGLIVGPHDPTDRFTYWPWRIAQGGEVLSPPDPDAPVQFIDVRDLSDWILRMIEMRRAGVFNVTGPGTPTTMKETLETIRDGVAKTSKKRALFTWPDKDLLLEAGVTPWGDLPLWVAEEELAGLMAVDVSKALARDLTFRSLAETAADTWAWAKSRPSDYEWRAGLTRSREEELLSAWRDRLP